MSELHTKKDILTFIASKDNEKAEVLTDFFSSVFTSETDSNIPELENLSVNETSSDELFSIVTWSKYYQITRTRWRTSETAL